MSRGLSALAAKWSLPSFCGAAAGLTALYVAQIIDAALAHAPMHEPASIAPYLIAGMVAALCSMPILRGCLTLKTGGAGAARRALLASTAAFVLFLGVAVPIAPDISGRELAYFFAVLVLFDWGRWTFLFAGWQNPSSLRAGSIGAFLDESLARSFVLAALSLTAVTPVLLGAGQLIAAQRIASWAVGFLLLGSVIAVFEHFLWPDNPVRVRFAARVLPALVCAVFLLGGYFLRQDARDTAELTFIMDVEPGYIADRVKAGDTLISDSASLRLASMRGKSSFLDLRPDQRGVKLWDDLITALENARRVFWIRVPGKGQDSQGLLAAFLNANGCLDDDANKELEVQLYELRHPLTFPRALPPALAQDAPGAFQPVQADYGAIRIIGVGMEQQACSHGALPVAVKYQIPGPSHDPLKLALSLIDRQGRRIRSQDFYIDDRAGRHTDRWDKGAQVSGYYLFAIPFGTVPGEYSLSAAVYSSSDLVPLRVIGAQNVVGSSLESATLGRFQVYRPEDLRADPYDTQQETALRPAHVPLAEGLILDAYGIDAQWIIPGESLTISAQWRALVDGMPLHTRRIVLLKGDQVVAEASGIPADGAYPASRWRAGESVLERITLPVPRQAEGGKARLEVGVPGGRSLYLADIEIATITRTFQIPSGANPAHVTFDGIGELIGYRLERTQVSSSDPPSVDFYWQAIGEIDSDFKVFAQLLASDGHLIAQSDSRPSSGKRPTRSWVKGELVVDPHTLCIVDREYRGEAVLIVGFYDPVSGERVAIRESRIGYSTLPQRVTVVGP